MTLTEQIGKHWHARQVPITDALLFPDGRIVIFRTFAIINGNHVSTGIERIAETTLDSVLSNARDAWFEVEPLCSVCDQANNTRYLAGGGDMGNEGFIAAEDLSSGALFWVACFNRSNPFDHIRIDGDTVRATNNHDEDWVVQLRNPSIIDVEKPI